MCKLYVDSYKPRYYPWRYKWPRDAHLDQVAPAWRWRIRCDGMTVKCGYQIDSWNRAMSAGLRNLPKVSYHIHHHEEGHPKT